MLLKLNDSINIETRNIKKVTGTLFAVLAFSTMATAPAAFAETSQLDPKTVNIKIKTSDLQTQQGTENVYKTIENRAKSICYAKKSQVRYGIDFKLCAADLVDQFIKSADFDLLTTYHSYQVN